MPTGSERNRKDPEHQTELQRRAQARRSNEMPPMHNCVECEGVQDVQRQGHLSGAAEQSGQRGIHVPFGDPREDAIGDDGRAARPNGVEHPAVERAGRQQASPAHKKASQGSSGWV